MNLALGQFDGLKANRDLLVDVHPAAQVRSHWNLLIMFLCTLLCWICPMMSHAQSSVEEYRLKAAFLLRFAEFVEWPADALGNTGNPFVLCLAGDPFQGDLQEMAQGKLIDARAVQIRHIKQVQEVRGCHLLFIGGNQSERVSDFTASLKSLPVLTVGESDDFLERRGIIRFCMDEHKVRFEISRDAAESAHLKISSKLLLLAKTVVGRGERR